MVIVYKMVMAWPCYKIKREVLDILLQHGGSRYGVKRHCALNIMLSQIKAV